MRDLVDLEIRNGDVVLREVPLRIVVPPELSKIGRPYFTFLGAEGCEYLEAYLRERMAKEEELGPGSPIITPKWAKKPFMRSLNVSDLIRKPMRAAGLKEPPYIFRSYFSSRAMLAESRGFLRDYKEFFMGHTGDIGHVYALHKQLPPDTIEAMRQAYQTGMEFLEARHDARRSDPVREMVRVRLETAGLDEQEIQALDLDELGHSDLAAILQEHAFKARSTGLARCACSTSPRCRAATCVPRSRTCKRCASGQYPSTAKSLARMSAVGGRGAWASASPRRHAPSEDAVESAAPDAGAEAVLGLIKQQEGESGAKWDEVLEASGLGDEAAEEAVNRLMDQGLVYEPTLGLLKTT